MKKKLIILLAINIALLGCTSKILVKNDQANKNCENIGVPITNLEAHIVTKNILFFDKNGKFCKELETSEILMLPSGSKYCLNIDPGYFAKNEVTIEVNSDGSLKKVIMNSDPQLDETIQSTANLVKEVGAILPITLMASGVDSTVDMKSCGKTTKVFNKGFVTLNEWKNSRK